MCFVYDYCIVPVWEHLDAIRNIGEHLYCSNDNTLPTLYSKFQIFTLVTFCIFTLSNSIDLSISSRKLTEIRL